MASQVAEVNLWTCDPGAERLHWEVIFDLDHWGVIDTVHASPIKLFRGDYLRALGIGFLATGSVKSVLEAQAEVECGWQFLQTHCHVGSDVPNGVS